MQIYDNFKANLPFSKQKPEVFIFYVTINSDVLSCWQHCDLHWSYHMCEVWTRTVQEDRSFLHCDVVVYSGTWYNWGRSAQRALTSARKNLFYRDRKLQICIPLLKMHNMAGITILSVYDSKK